MTVNDLEVSTFQKRPCYRYIRTADKLPALGSGARVARVKLFDPCSGWTWYLAEYDPETRQAYGVVVGNETERGYFDMGELVSHRSNGFGLPIERDLHWTPCPLSEIAGAS